VSGIVARWANGLRERAPDDRLRDRRNRCSRRRKTFARRASRGLSRMSLRSSGLRFSSSSRPRAGTHNHWRDLVRGRLLHHLNDTARRMGPGARPGRRGLCVAVVARMSAAISGIAVQEDANRLLGLGRAVFPDIAQPVIGCAFAQPVGSSGLIALLKGIVSSQDRLSPSPNSSFLCLQSLIDGYRFAAPILRLPTLMLEAIGMRNISKSGDISLKIPI
jgi:hypothetical protein